MILLDSDVMIDILREYPPAVAWLESLGDETLGLPGYVAMELIQGCANRGEQARVEKALEPYVIEWPTPETCNQALGVFAQFHLSHKLGLLDALIGQMAIALNTPLHTFNEKHYVLIPGLRIIQPYIKA